MKKTATGYDIEIGKDFAPYRTVWTDKKYDANEYGSQLISSMVPENDFTFPKSVYNTYECLRAVTLYRPDALILDFFAGSGTTGHATLMLNKELGGNRRFILCTNNDVGEKKEKEYKRLYGEIDPDSETWHEWQERYGIALSVTYPRVKAAIEGFVHTKDFKEVLYQKKITPTVLRNSERMLSEANQIIEASRDSFTSIQTVVENDVFKVIGITKRGQRIEGISSNLKYYKTDFIERATDFLADALLEHTKEMIQIEQGVRVDGQRFLLVLSEEDADQLEIDWNEYEEIKGIYISRSVLLTTTQNELFSTVNVQRIPDYYFHFEMKEIGETW